MPAADPLALAADGHHRHADLGRQFEIGQRAVSHVAAVAHPHAVRHLLGRRQGGDERPGYAEPAGDDAADVDGGIAHALDGADDLEHRSHGVGITG